MIYNIVKKRGLILLFPPSADQTTEKLRCKEKSFLGYRTFALKIQLFDPLMAHFDIKWFIPIVTSYESHKLFFYKLQTNYSSSTEFLHSLFLSRLSLN